MWEHPEGFDHELRHILAEGAAQEAEYAKFITDAEAGDNTALSYLVYLAESRGVTVPPAVRLTRQEDGNYDYNTLSWISYARNEDGTPVCEDPMAGFFEYLIETRARALHLHDDWQAELQEEAIIAIGYVPSDREAEAVARMVNDFLGSYNQGPLVDVAAAVQDRQAKSHEMREYRDYVRDQKRMQRDLLEETTYLITQEIGWRDDSAFLYIDIPRIMQYSEHLAALILDPRFDAKERQTQLTRDGDALVSTLGLGKYQGQLKVIVPPIVDHIMTMVENEGYAPRRIEE